MTWRVTWVGAVVLGCGVLGCKSKTLEPTAPQPQGDARATIEMPPLPPLRPSVVNAPITYRLQSSLDALERAVPRHFGDLTKQIAVPSNRRQHMAFEATRTRFATAFDGHRLTLATTVTYQGRAWYKPLMAPTISSSCGTDGPRPRLRVVLTTDVDLTPAWTVDARTRVLSVTPLTTTPRDQCKLTPFKIDVTDQVAKGVTGKLQGTVSILDQRIANFDVRAPIDRWYNLLNRSFRVRDSLWMVLQPTSVALGRIAVRDSLLVFDVRLSAQPTLVSGPRPLRTYTRVPALSRTGQPVSDSASFRLEALLSYDDASIVLTERLAGRRLRRFSHSIVIQKVRLYAIGDGRVVVDVTLTGDIRGHAYFLGTPTLDTVTSMLTVPDLDFDVETSNALVQGLAWFKKADIVAELRQRARIPLGPPVEELRSAAERVLDRQLTQGVRLSGRIRTGRMIDVVAQTRWLVVRAEATGSMALSIDRAIEPGWPRGHGGRKGAPMP